MAPAKKTQKMSLGDFLGDQSLGSWADEMEDMPMPSESRGGYGDRRAFSTGPGFGGDRGFDRGDRFPPREQLPLPNKPPYTAHLGNLSFDATEGDIHDLFAECEVTNVRIVEDKFERKPKGFGYVEFGTLDGLKKALDISGTSFQGRTIRVSIAEPPRERGEAREPLDWTRKGPLPDLPNTGRRVSDKGGYRSWDATSDAGSERGERRRPFHEGDGKPRDFNNWERKGPLSPLPQTGSMREGGRVRSNDGPRERKNSPSWGEGRSQDGSRPPRREYQERPHHEKPPTAAELDNQWRASMRPDPPVRSPVPSPKTSTPSSPKPSPAAPATRPKLNLQKRTVSESEPATTSASGKADAKSSPFGAARPVDTAAKEREVEEKRQLALRLKKEQEDKAKEEKKAREATAKAEKATEKTEKAAAPDSKAESKENGSGEPAPGRNYEILRRMEGEGDDTDDNEAGGANGTIVDDKEVKPKEPAKPSEGSWRQKSSTPATTDKPEDDGWSTVPTKSRGKGRGGNQASRAIAS